MSKESRDANLTRARDPLPGLDVEQNTRIPFVRETRLVPAIVRVGYRTFDRQHLIADHRVLHGASPSLWAARALGQVFAIEQHAKPISDGPGVVFSALISDMDYFKGSEGGRALPLLHLNGESNCAAGLLDSLTDKLGSEATASDLISYIAAVTAHAGFTSKFTDELTTPGIRVPITADVEVWSRQSFSVRRLSGCTPTAKQSLTRRATDRTATSTCPSKIPTGS